MHLHICAKHKHIDCPMCNIHRFKYHGDLGVEKQLTLQEILSTLKEIIEQTPNDQELGAKIRKLWETL